MVECLKIEGELDGHMLAGKHNSIQTRTSYDEVRSSYRQRAINDVEQFRPQATTVDSVPSEVATRYFQTGWALPIRKGGKLDN